MKTKIFLLTFTALLFTVSCNLFKSDDKFSNKHQEVSCANSRDALDWQGRYIGIAPCENCDETNILIELNEDLTFKMQTLNRGETEIKEFKGNFSWDKQGRTITLQLAENEKRYLVGENILILLDEKNNPITNKHSENYALNKTTVGITERYWRLIEIRGVQIEGSSGFSQEPHIIFQTEDNRIVGNGGCNGFGGSYEIQAGNRISFSQVFSTQMACLNMEVEGQFLQILSEVDNFTVSPDGNYLSLNRARMAPLARFEVVYLR
jgi:heat shock protein HslJ